MANLEKKLVDYVSEGFLLHGSRANINSKSLRSEQGQMLYATNNYEIALMKAIVSNANLSYPGLVYPLVINEKNPMELHIYGMNEETIGEKGYIYVVSKEGFSNEPLGSCQYIIRKEKVPIIEKINVLRSDLKIPIFSVVETKIQ